MNTVPIPDPIPDTCGQVVDDGARVCGEPVTDIVSWPMWPDGVCRPQTPVTRNVCGSCADALMSWAATHLRPTRTPVWFCRFCPGPIELDDDDHRNIHRGGAS